MSRYISPSKRPRRHACGASNTDTETAVATLRAAPSPKLHKQTIQDRLCNGSSPPSSNPASNLHSSLERVVELPVISQKGDEALLRSGRLVKVPKDSREGPDLLSETRTRDRQTMLKINDRISINNKMSWVHKMLRAYDQDKTGKLTHDQLRSVLDRLRCGLDKEEATRVIHKLDQDGSGSVPFDRLLGAFEQLEQLGDPLSGEQLEHFGLGNNVQVMKPWEERRGGMTAWKPAAVAMIGVTNKAEPGSYEEQKEDLYLMGLVRGKLNQHKERLRLLFRQMDVNRNSLIDKEEFVTAIQALRMQVEKPQIERLFELADKDKSGSVDYEEFIHTFEGQDVLSSKLKGKGAHQPLAESMGIEPAEVAAVFRSPLTYELQRKLYNKAAFAHNVFKQFDLNGDGCLSVDELSKCCSILVPGIERRDVAAMMVKADKSGDGYLNYKEFISSLVDDGPSNPAMVEVQLRREELPEIARNGWGQCPIWTRPITPRSCCSSLLVSTTARSQSLQTEGGPPLLASRDPSQPTANSDGSLANLNDLVHHAALSPVVDSLARSASAGHATSTGFAPLTVPALSQSLDLSSLLRKRDPALSERASNPLSRSDRFWSKKHPDTSHVTGVDVQSSQYMPLCNTFLRKTDPAYMMYQKDDEQKRMMHHDTERGNYTGRVQLAESVPQAFDSVDQGRLAAMSLLKQRYKERALMYDEARKAEARGATIFGRLNIYHEHDNCDC